jgi:hypothetical protein
MYFQITIEQAFWPEHDIAPVGRHPKVQCVMLDGGHRPKQLGAI